MSMLLIAFVRLFIFVRHSSRHILECICRCRVDRLSVNSSSTYTRDSRHNQLHSKLLDRLQIHSILSDTATSAITLPFFVRTVIFISVQLHIEPTGGVKRLYLHLYVVCS